MNSATTCGYRQTEISCREMMISLLKQTFSVAAKKMSLRHLSVTNVTRIILLKTKTYGLSILYAKMYFNNKDTFSSNEILSFCHCIF